MKPHNHTDYQKRFFKEVKKQFPFYGKREKEYLKQFQTEIDAYLEEFPDSSYEAMLEAIGTPKDVVENYFQNVEDRYQLSHMKKSNYIRIGIITIIGIFLMLNYNLRFWFAKLNSWESIWDKYKCYQLRF